MYNCISVTRVVTAASKYGSTRILNLPVATAGVTDEVIWNLYMPASIMSHPSPQTMLIIEICAQLTGR